MSSSFNLDQIDADGAIRETAGEMSETLAQDGDTRLDFLKKAGIAGGAVMGGGALLSALVPGVAFGRPPKQSRPPVKPFGKGDIGILNYALLLEYLEKAFYVESGQKLNPKDKATADFQKAVIADETAHVKILKGILGKKALAEPTFDFGNTTSDEALFVATAYALENTGVSAYSGQAFNIDDSDVLAGALAIVTIEGRHSGLVGQILKGSEGIAPDGPLDKPVGARATIKKVKATKFITGGIAL